MPDYAIPAQVLANAQQRLAAVTAYTRRPCRTPACDNPATHWPATGTPACEQHRTRPAPPVPDPERTLDGLRRKAHLRLDQAPGYRTVLDTRAEDTGRRVSAARRAAARGDRP